MLDINSLESFHFLRPVFFLTLLPIAVLHWKLRQLYHGSDGWESVIAPHLLGHLTVNTQRRGKIRPYQLLTVLLLLTLLAAAGPSWRKVITPFTEDQAPLVIALELSQSMLAVDQAPTRLERAKQKIRGLLESRQGARTALITYSGSAHVALPFTDDSDLVEAYLESLHPSLMPVDGDRPELALEQARRLLAPEPTSGTVIYMTDGMDQSHADVFSQFSATSDDQLLLLGFGTAEGGLVMDEGNRITDLQAPGTDWSGLTSIANAAQGSLLRASLDDSDISALGRLIRTNLVNALNQDDETQWQESGYYLSWVLMLMGLIWFRQGWTVI